MLRNYDSKFADNGTMVTSSKRVADDAKQIPASKLKTNFIVYVAGEVKTIVKSKVKVSDPSCCGFINFTSISPLLNVELKGKKCN